MLRLRGVIDSYRADQREKLDGRALELLTRLADPRGGAGDALRGLKLKNRRAEVRILTACIKADHLARALLPRLTSAKELLVHLERLEKEVINVRRYVDEVSEQQCLPHSDLFSTRIRDRLDSIAAMKRGLRLIAGRIDRHRRITKKDILQLKATRKNRTKQAAELAAIRCLGNEVWQVTGRKHLMAVADIAQIVLGIEVSWDRVSYALRNLRHKDRQQKKASSSPHR